MSTHTPHKTTVFITGSGRGIGQAIALYFAQSAPEKYNLVINSAKNLQELEQTRRQISDCLHASCLALPGDVGDYAAVREMFSKIEEAFGPVDILINNAGISHIGLFTEMTPGQWEHILQTNLTSVFNCCHLAAPAMIRRHSGKIINISSVWGNVGASCEVAYSAAKGGMNTFTKALAKELAPSNIQVNAIACGVIDTAMNQCFCDDERQALIDEIPACRMGTPNEVAALAYRLATEHDYLTGQIIALDGGWI